MNDPFGDSFSVEVGKFLCKVYIDRSKPITSLINPRYIPEDNALGIAETVHSALGEKDEAKEWLTACLLKTIEDQLHGKRTELIDNFPEAFSWLKDII
jgi:hypothetical protein